MLAGSQVEKTKIEKYLLSYEHEHSPLYEMLCMPVFSKLRDLLAWSGSATHGPFISMDKNERSRLIYLYFSRK